MRDNFLLQKELRFKPRIIENPLSVKEEWERIKKLFGEIGSPGFTYLKSISEKKIALEYYIYRGKKGDLLGYIEHIASGGIPYDRKGNINIFVHPEYWGNGIGLSLLKKGFQKWKIDFKSQEYTYDGFQLLLKFLREIKKPY